MNSALIGPLFIALGAFLWATDALFRAPMVAQLDPIWIVFAEHAIVLAVLLPFAWIHLGRKVFALNKREWLAALVIGAGASTTATIAFTSAFRFINPSIVILLQKMQPMISVLFAMIFLRERPLWKFYPWALLAALSGIVLSFPDLNFEFLDQGIQLRSQGVLLALLAATLWALATVAGKTLLNRQTPSVTTFWRYAFGFLGSLAFLYGKPEALNLDATLHPGVLSSLAYMALVPGLIAMLAYYRGLNHTQASIATWVELVFPVSAVALNTFFLDAPLQPIQLIAGCVLLLAISQTSRSVPRSH